MTVFERTYRELERLEGVSLHDDVMLYKVTPERTEQEISELWQESHIRAHCKEKPWKLKALIALAVIGWWWYELAKHLRWIS